MDDALLVGFLKPFCNLDGDVQRFVQGQRASLDLVGERRPVDVSHRDEGLALLLVDAVNSPDIWVVERHTIELLLSKVESVQVHQSVMGRILGYSSVIVVGTGGTKDQFPNVAQPLELRPRAQQLIMDVQGH